MVSARVHFEVYVRKKPTSGWTLEMATENRALAISTAEDLIKEGRVTAAKVTKETLDEETREFQTVTILNLGAPDTTKKRKVKEDIEPLCVTPQDLYTIHARERISRLLEAWLERRSATAFELLHRPDLVEKLEASGTDLQHAIQKIAVPEAQARGATTHDMMRSFQQLVERAVDRLMSDHRKGALPDLAKEGLNVAAERLAHHPDRHYLMGCGVAAAIEPASSWSEKVAMLLDLADSAPHAGPGRALVLSTIEQPLAEILGGKLGLEELLGRGMDLGGNLAGMTRLTASEAVDKLIEVEPSVAKVMPKLSASAARLSKWLTAEGFLEVRTALGKRILAELNGPRRLRPGDAAGEIDILRALAMSLTSASGNLLPLDEVQSAFSARSKMLVTGDFVESYLGREMSAIQEAEALVWLTENVIGPANKRQAGRWIKAVVSALRFEKEFRKNEEESPAARLAQLAVLQKSVSRCGLVPEDYVPIQQKIGEIGGMVEAEGKIAWTLGRAQAPVVQRLTVLLRLASGESAPLGPAADRARSEAMRLIRQDDTRAELAKAPEQMSAMREMIQQAGLAA
ncbi:hypothetical protein [Phenylobacterium deserti]|uniref:Uncharacterized protein n=1 Tax=Phenylobacterium deserti TaxID=1914756 RepID=A0A328ASN2_9CAUL|nr:hypothetical protein [Phenylobacterium deserti]RAK57271.1 hypothetical protein DJ018_04805 [Phenylobacterium deserti]